VNLVHQQLPPQKESQSSLTCALAIYRRCYYRALSSTSRNVRVLVECINNTLTFDQIRSDCEDLDQVWIALVLVFWVIAGGVTSVAREADVLAFC
jgi:hypothetical protein